ncbi:MAG: signal peptidase II [Bacilli bacterium]
MKKKIYVMSLIFFLIDFLSKILVICFEDRFPVTIISNFFILDKVTNEGAAFSLFSGYTFLLVFISVFVLYYINKNIIKDIKSKFGKLGISMLIGGIFGNLFDRVFYGKVIDFLSFKIFGYMFPIFNLADTFICVGVGLLIIEFLRGGKNENKSK